LRGTLLGRCGLPLLAGALLLQLYQIVKPLPLFRRQHRPEILYGLLELLPPARLHCLLELFHAFLALLEDLVNRLALFGRQVQLPLHAAEELNSHYARKRGLRGVGNSNGALRAAIPTMFGIPDQ
jgi:hypothetical protein